MVRTRRIPDNPKRLRRKTRATWGRCPTPQIPWPDGPKTQPEHNPSATGDALDADFAAVAAAQTHNEGLVSSLSAYTEAAGLAALDYQDAAAEADRDLAATPSELVRLAEHHERLAAGLRSLADTLGQSG
jgi:hypothetical protein